MLQVDFGLTPFEFKDRFGTIRTCYGYSLLGKTEFWERMEALINALLKRSQNVSVQIVTDLYLKDDWFKHNCDRCLMLNGIDPDWLDGQGLMLTSLLFTHEGGNSLLATYNTEGSIATNPPKPDEKPGGIEDAIASLWLAEGSYERAIEVARRPYKEVISTIKSRGEMTRTPEERKKAEREKQARQAQEAIAQDLAGFMSGFGGKKNFEAA